MRALLANSYRRRCGDCGGTTTFISAITCKPPAEPRPGHPGQLAELPREQQRRRRGEGGAYAGSPAGARRTQARARGDWREKVQGAADAAAEPGTAPPSLDAAAEPGTAPPSLDAAEGKPPTRGRSDPGTEPER